MNERPRWTVMDLAPALRVAFTTILVLLQFVMCWLFVRFLREYAVTVYVALELLCGVIIVALISRNREPSYRYAWVVLVLLLGVFGLVMYLLWGRGTGRNALSQRIVQSCAAREGLLLAEGKREEQEALLDTLAQAHPEGQRISRYLYKLGFPAYDQTGVRYFTLGEHAFEAMLEDIAEAKAFIYLQFFIVTEGQIWDRFFALLADKAQQGVQVRMMYDDAGSITMPSAFRERLHAIGAEVAVFNPVHRHVNQLYLNYRDHRKILAIDGQIAYTGGINLADEYANLYAKHGHWKDTAVRLDGPAAASLTLSFLQTWQALTGQSAEEAFRALPPPAARESDGCVLPYEDGPQNNPENPAETVYREMMNAARRTLYVTTPYLVIDDMLLEALCQAARSGVDVRVVVPSIPDHWYVHLTSQSFYGELLAAGVRVYEYTPGFMHAKMVCVDAEQAVVGTVNMDFRSFNLHYECAVWLCGGTVPGQVHEDILAALALSREVSLDEWRKRRWYVKALQPCLRLFSPLM